MFNILCLSELDSDSLRDLKLLASLVNLSPSFPLTGSDIGISSIYYNFYSGFEIWLLLSDLLDSDSD